MPSLRHSKKNWQKKKDTSNRKSGDEDNNKRDCSIEKNM